MLILCK